jgi:periplasmic protein TonB
MVVLFSIISLVVIVSLYDFLSSGKWQRVTSNKRNNIVFERRNKAYGAYLIRRDYNMVMSRIVLSVGAGFLLLFGGNMYANRNHLVVTDENKKNGEVIILPIPPIDKPEKIIDIQPDNPKNDAKAAPSTKFTDPEVSDDDDFETDLPTNDELEDKNIGNQNKEGEEDDFTVTTDKILPNNNVLPPDDDNTYVQVSEMAMFPGGKDAMFKFIIDNIDYIPSSFDDENYGQVTVRFVVSKTGEISSASIYKAPDGCSKCIEAALKIIKKMPKWIPAKLDGKEVNSYFQIPIVFSGAE